MPIDPAFLTPGGALSSPLLAKALQGIGAHPGGADSGSAAPGTPIGPYRIERELGRGGMAVVYLARRADGEFEQNVALKLVRPEGNSEFAQTLLRQERQILAGMQHPGIARLLDGGHTADGQLWFAMELVPGRRIDRYCSERALSGTARLQLFLQVCAAMQFAHGRLLVHRDIKPSNILVTNDGNVKLLDFGIAQVLDCAASAALSGNSLTPDYASPEQKRGEMASTASDIYQLGRLLQRLFQARVDETNTSTQTSTASATTLLQPLDAHSAPTTETGTLPRDLAAIISKATHHYPALRYATVAELSGDVENLLAHRPVNARHGGAFYRGACFLRRHAIASATAAVVIIAFVAMVTMFAVRLAHERDQARNAAAQAKQEAARANQVRDFLIGMFQVADPNVNRGDKLTATQILERGAANADNALAGQSELQANLLVVIGEVYASLGDYPRAEPALAHGVTLLRGQTAAPLELAHALRQYAYAEHKLDKFAQARELLDEAQALLRDRPEARSELAAVLDQRGLVQKHLNELEGALASHRAAQIAATDAGDEARLATIDNHLGLLLFDLDRNREAQATYEQALALARRHFGERDTRTSSIEENLAAVLSMQGDYAQALQMMLSAAATERELIGEDNDDYPQTINMLGNIYADAGRMDEAAASYERALAIVQRIGRGESELAASLLGNLGSAYAELKRFDEARARLERSVAIQSVLNGRDHIEVVHTRTMLAELDVDQNQPQRAESAARQLLEALNGKVPATHRYFIDAQGVLARALVAQNRGAEARRIIESALANAGSVSKDDSAIKQLKEMLAAIPQASNAPH